MYNLLYEVDREIEFLCKNKISFEQPSLWSGLLKRSRATQRRVDVLLIDSYDGVAGTLRFGIVAGDKLTRSDGWHTVYILRPLLRSATAIFKVS